MSEIYSPTLKGHAEARREAKKIDLIKALKKGIRKTGGEFNSSDHVYKLMIGSDWTNIVMVMPGRKAQLQNKLNQLKFGSGKHKRLNRWSLQKDLTKELREILATDAQQE